MHQRNPSPHTKIVQRGKNREGLYINFPCKNVLFWWRNGGHIQLNCGVTINLDPTFPPENGIVLFTHGHSDHVCSTDLPAIGSQLTLSIISRSRKITNPLIISEGKNLRYDEFTIKAFSSGHVIGSLEFLIECDGISILYTGDMLAEDTTVTKGAVPVNADVLIIESTYGHLDVAFPPRRELYETIRKWIRSYPPPNIFYAYPLGKPQELIPLLNSEGIFPSVDKQISIVNSIAQSDGSFNGKWYLSGLDKKSVNIRSMRNFSRDVAVPANKMVLTGWSALRSYPKANSLLYSSHSHKRALIEFVEQVSPKHVVTFSSGARHFAKELEKRGIHATPASEQTMIF